MKITALKAYQVHLPLSEGTYNWSGGKTVSVFDTTVVSLETDSGITGTGNHALSAPYTFLPTRPVCARVSPSLLPTSSALTPRSSAYSIS